MQDPKEEKAAKQGIKEGINNLLAGMGMPKYTGK